MISDRIKLIDVDPEHWINLRRLIKGDLRLDGQRRQSKGERPARVSLRLVVKDGRCLKATRSDRGLLPGYQPPTLDDPAELARLEGVDSVAIIEQGAPRRLMHEIQSRLTLDMNYAEQLFLILEVVREELKHGIRLHPRPRIPKIKYGAIASVIKGVVPANELIVVVIYSDDGAIRDSSGLPIATSIIARLNGRGECDLLTTTDALAGLGLAVADWRKDYKRVNELAERALGSKMFVGIHLPLSSLPEIVRETSPQHEGPSALLSLRKADKLIIDPLPLRFRAMLKMSGMLGKK